jgi:hypothetical protein
MVFDLSAGEAGAICGAIEQLRKRGFAASIRLHPDGPGRAAVGAAGRIAGQLDPTRVATEWRAWLQAAGALTSQDDDDLDTFVADLTIRRPRFADWLDRLASRTPADGFGDLNGMAIEGMVLGDAAAVRAARLLAERTGDERYWRPASVGDPATTEGTAATTLPSSA